MNTARPFTVLAVALLGWMPCVTAPMAAQTAYERYRKAQDVITTRAVNANTMLEAGKTLLAKAPAEIRNGSPLERARYAFVYYNATLAANNVPVNDDYWNRFQNLVRNGQADKWTCADHAVNLTELFKGMGIASSDMNDFMADDNSLAGTVTPNGNHGAVAIYDNGTYFFFDPWQLARGNGGSYAGSSRSKWNGMEAAAWETEMQRQGYVRFSANGGYSYDKSLVNILPRQKVARTVPPPVQPTQAFLVGRWTGTWKNSRDQQGPWTISLEERADGTITGLDDGEKILDGKRNGNTMTWTMKSSDGKRWWSESVQIQDGGNTLVANYTGHDTETRFKDGGTYTGGGTLRKR